MLSLLTWWVAVWLGQSASTAPAPLVAAPPAAAQVEQLLTQLADPRYQVREGATEALCHLGVADLPLLVRHYRTESRYEPKRRIRFIIESVFHRDQMLGHNGFMGVQVYQQVLSDLIDPQSKRGTRGVLVKDVKPGFAARKAGVLDQDVVIALDGDPIPEDPTTISFVQKVSSRAPGTRIALRILRPQAVQDLKVSVGTEPAKLLQGARLETVPFETSPQGMWIAGIEEKTPAAALGLKSNTILRSVNHVPMGGYANTQLDNILGGLKPGAELTLQVIEMKLMTISVLLGSRPPEFITEKDLAEARLRFLQWWQAQGGEPLPRPVDLYQQRIVWGGFAPMRVGVETTLLP